MTSVLRRYDWRSAKHAGGSWHEYGRDVTIPAKANSVMAIQTYPESEFTPRAMTMLATAASGFWSPDPLCSYRFLCNWTQRYESSDFSLARSRHVLRRFAVRIWPPSSVVTIYLRNESEFSIKVQVRIAGLHPGIKL